jgi:hypothetical protein
MYSFNFRYQISDLRFRVRWFSCLQHVVIQSEVTLTFLTTRHSTHISYQSVDVAKIMLGNLKICFHLSLYSSPFCRAILYNHENLRCGWISINSQIYVVMNFRFLLIISFTRSSRYLSHWFTLPHVLELLMLHQLSEANYLCFVCLEIENSTARSQHNKQHWLWKL